MYEKQSCNIDRDVVCANCTKCSVVQIEVQGCSRALDTTCVPISQTIRATIDFADGSARAIYGFGEENFHEEAGLALTAAVGLSREEAIRFNNVTSEVLGFTVRVGFNVLPPREMWDHAGRITKSVLRFHTEGTVAADFQAYRDECECNRRDAK